VHVRAVNKGGVYFVLVCKLATGHGVSVMLVGSAAGTCYSRCCWATRLAACGSKDHCVQLSATRMCTAPLKRENCLTPTATVARMA
jgi:hypothetical protein